MITTNKRMKKTVRNVEGQQFGLLTFLSFAFTRGTGDGSTDAYWNCRCTCGTVKIIRRTSVTSGRTQSCGCALKLRTSLRRGYLNG